MMEATFPKEVVERLCAALEAPESDDSKARPSVRINPAKAGFCPFEGAEPVEWSDGKGFFLPSRPSYVADPLFHAGAYYVQDSSSMIVGEVFRRLASELQGLDRPVRILDLCAAPGGKTTDLAASARSLFGSNYILVANEPISSRAGVLKENVTKWGDPNVVVVSNDPSVFAANLPGWFDIILTDVPCSGEGMFRKEQAAIDGWSPDAVETCVGRSGRIVGDAISTLRPGGILIYSTCTFNSRENEEVPQSFQALECITPEFSDPRFIKTAVGYTLAPGFIEGEGQSFSAFRKSAEDSLQGMPRHGKSKGKPSKSKLPDLSSYFNCEVSLKLKSSGQGKDACELIKAYPSRILSEIEQVEDALSVLSSGVLAFEVKGRDLIPQQDLAWSIILRPEAFPRADLNLLDAQKYLSKDNILLPGADKGVILLSYAGVPMAFCKNLGGRVNNLYPKGYAIRTKVY